jgi:Icc-related predicted phosphoesterase
MSMFKRKNRGAKGGRAFTRLFFASDVHGSNECFSKFLNASTSYGCDVLVMGGDITGKSIMPLVRQDDGTLRAEFLGSRRVLRTEEEKAELVRVAGDGGVYTYETDEGEIGALESAADRAVVVEEISERLMRERVEEWVTLAEERLGGSDVKLFMSCGNDDPFSLDQLFDDSPYVVRHDGRIVRVDEHHEMIGLGFANQTPWECPRDISEDELTNRIDALVGRVEDMQRCLFSIHVPPVDSQLDTCPKLDTSVYPPAMITDGAGEPMMFGAGSKAVRAAIERYQPLAGLHGHIHESRGVSGIGRTQVFNPGSEYSEGILRGLIVNLDEDGIMSYQFTSG